MKKIISGYTCESADSLILNAGAWFKNYNVATDSFGSAVSDGKLIGATSGGGTFTAVPNVRTIDIDGLPSGAKGATQFDGWVVTMQTNLIEISAQALADAIGASVMTLTTDGRFNKIQGKNFVENSDYIDNVTWLGTLSGSDEPVIIQIFNALATTGITLQTQDKAQAILPVTFAASQDNCSGDSDLEHAPFAIYYPVAVAKPKINPITSGSTSIGGTGLANAVINISGGTIQPGETTIVSVDGTWELAIAPQTAGTIIKATQTVNGRTSVPAEIIVTEA